MVEKDSITVFCTEWKIRNLALELNHLKEKRTLEQRLKVNNVRSMPVLLQVIPVTVHGPNGYLNTHGMLDSGSTCSLVLSSVAEKLGLEGSEERIILNGIQGTSELNSRRVNTQVSAVNMMTPRFEVNRALVVEHLNIALQKVNLVDVNAAIYRI